MRTSRIVNINNMGQCFLNGVCEKGSTYVAVVQEDTTIVLTPIVQLSDSEAAKYGISRES